MLEINEVCYTYPHTKREILKGVSLRLDKGEILCLLGSNGVGKTTLLRCLLGFEKPSRGEIVIDGINVSELSIKKRAHYMAYVPQLSDLAFPYTAREVVRMGRISHLVTGAGHSKRDMEAVDAALERLQITHLAERRFQEMSGGERQMVLVARALAQEAKFLVMDEPTANLDYHNQVKILAAIKYLASRGFCILMTSHYPDHAFLACSQAALMKDGRVVSSGDPNVVVTSQSLTDLYDTPVYVGTTQIGGVDVKTCVPLIDETRYVRKEAQEHTDT